MRWLPLSRYGSKKWAFNQGFDGLLANPYPRGAIASK